MDLQSAKLKADEAVDLGVIWKPLHECLAEESADSEMSLLSQAILGGRSLLRTDNLEVVLIRPDLVPHVADALQKVEAAIWQVEEQIKAEFASRSLIIPLPNSWKRFGSKIFSSSSPAMAGSS